MSYTTRIGNATATTPGIIQLSGDLGGTATAPTIQKIGSISAANISSKGSATGVVVESNGSYGARPSGYANVKFIGPDDPGTLAQNGDEWVKLS